MIPEKLVKFQNFHLGQDLAAVPRLPNATCGSISGPEAKMEEQKPPHLSLRGFGTGNIKLATFEDCLLHHLSTSGWRLACCTCRLSLNFSVWLLELYVTSQIPLHKNIEWTFPIRKEPLNASLEAQ